MWIMGRGGSNSSFLVRFAIDKELNLGACNTDFAFRFQCVAEGEKSLSFSLHGGREMGILLPSLTSP